MNRILSVMGLCLATVLLLTGCDDFYDQEKAVGEVKTYYEKNKDTILMVLPNLSSLGEKGCSYIIRADRESPPQTDTKYLAGWDREKEPISEEWLDLIMQDGQIVSIYFEPQNIIRFNMKNMGLVTDGLSYGLAYIPDDQPVWLDFYEEYMNVPLLKEGNGWKPDWTALESVAGKTIMDDEKSIYDLYIERIDNCFYYYAIYYN